MTDREPVAERLATASTLPSRWYLDPAVLDRERRDVFAATWQWVGPLAGLEDPGAYRCVEVAGEPVIVVRATAGDGDGRLRALSNVCRHRAGPVASGCGTARGFVCGYHGWRYHLDGRLARAPGMGPVEGFDPAAVALPAFEVDVWAGQVFVRLTPGGPSLLDHLGEVADEVAAAGFDLADLALARRRTYTVGCNWKVYVDNFLEGYHLPLIHPGLTRVLAVDAYRVEPRRHHSRQHAPFRTDPPAGGYPGGGADADALYYWVFPNLMLNLYPGNAQWNLVQPDGPDRTTVTFEWYARSGDDSDDQRALDEAVAFADEVQAEDAAICETVQRGLASRHYDAGRYSVRHEAGVHHFHRLLLEALEIA